MAFRIGNGDHVNAMSRSFPALRGRQGFTLIELVVVLAIVALLLALATPRYFHSIDKSKETVLKANLALTRDSLDKYYGDNGKYPDQLATLVEKKYLRTLPMDPITESTTTWIIVPPADSEKGAVFDIHSGAEGNGSDGTPYREW
jgi:general secretion pathway protein G